MMGWMKRWEINRGEQKETDEDKLNAVTVMSRKNAVFLDMTPV
jgi:hypothetical protein